MTEPEAAEADLLEQEEEVAVTEPPELGAEVPEADALEQAQATSAGQAFVPPQSLPDGVPEADALEQAYVVDVDDDYDRG